MSEGPTRVEDLLRELAPQVLGALVRRHGATAFDACEDAVQEALLAAALQWPADGGPENPRGWLVTVAARRLVDQVRSESARRRREEALALATPQSALLAPAADTVALAGGGLGAGAGAPEHDDSLTLLFLCCHPALSTPSRIALTLRAVGGLTTAQIAAAFLVPEATMAQRISRAKQTIKGLALPEPGSSVAQRLAEVRHVLYLIFNEGYTASGGEELTAPQLSAEAIRLTRLLLRLTAGGDGAGTRSLPDAETAGLLALMLLTDARRPARTGSHGELVPLADQDRSRWHRELLDEGLELISRTLPLGRPGPYQVQAAIAAVHGEADHPDTTDWPQILALYDLLLRFDDNPMVALNRAVAAAMVHGPAAGLDLVAELAADKRLARHHRLLAVRAHLLELHGELDEAAATYRAAAARTASAPERRHLAGRAQKLSEERGMGIGMGMRMTDWNERVVAAPDGARVSYRDWGGPGTPVVLLHGLAGHAGEWDVVARELRASGCRVVALDQRGHGASERHPDDVTRAAYVADVAAVVRELGLVRPVLVGQSMGGNTALLTAAAHPDLVRALVLVEAGAGGSDPDAPARIGGWLRAWPVPFPTREAAAEYLGGGPVGAGWAAGLERRPDGWWPRFDPDVLEASLAVDAGRGYWGEWAGLDCPTLVVLAQNGIIPAADVDRMLADRPETVATSVCGTGHDLHLERPQVLLGLVTGFLAALPAGVG